MWPRLGELIKLFKGITVIKSTKSAELFLVIWNFRSTFNLGEYLCLSSQLALLNFQVTVRLESVEEDLSNTNNAPFVHVHEVKYIVTMYMKDCHCVLSIPGNGVPAFETDSGF